MPRARWSGASAATSRCGSIRPWAMRSSRINPLIPKETPTASRAFAEPIGRLEDLKSVVRRLAEELCRQLERRGEGVRRLDLSSQRVDQKSACLRVGTAKANRDAAPSRQALRRVPADRRSRLRHRGGRPCRQQGRASGETHSPGDGILARRTPARRTLATSSTVSAPASGRRGLPPRARQSLVPERHDAQDSARSRHRPAPSGRRTCRGRRAFSIRRSPWWRPRCSPITRRRSSSGARFVTGSSRPTARSASRREWWSGAEDLSRPRLLPRRDRTRRALLDLPRRADRRGRALVDAWVLRMTLCRASGHDPFLVPARRLEPARTVRAGEDSSASRRSASPTATRWPGSCAPMRPSRRRACASSSVAGSISTDGTSLLVYPTDRAAYSPPVPAAQHRQEPRRQGQVPPRLGRCRRPGTRG